MATNDVVFLFPNCVSEQDYEAYLILVDAVFAEEHITYTEMEADA